MDAFETDQHPAPVGERFDDRLPFARAHGGTGEKLLKFDSHTAEGLAGLMALSTIFWVDLGYSVPLFSAHLMDIHVRIRDPQEATVIKELRKQKEQEAGCPVSLNSIGTLLIREAVAARRSKKK